MLTDLLIRNWRYLPARLWRKIVLGLDPERLAVFTLDDGSRFECSLKDSTGRLLTLNALETTERGFVRQRLQPGDTFVDVGANRGLYSVVAARRVGPAGRVLAFEPSPREINYLKRNLGHNQLANVTVVAAAVGAQAGRADLLVAADGGLNSLARTEHPEQVAQSTQPVDVSALDDYLAEHSVGRVHFMKIDVEGAEAEVLRGAAGLLTGPHPPIILCEFCDATAAGFGSSGHALYQAFESYGFALHALSPTASGAVELVPAPPQPHYELENLVAIHV
ncbi:MAG: FkbM family methyltransferase [Anaerolineales bacterium]|nr:FkbM family methyltransferase [Anaerolineales bacterium]